MTRRMTESDLHRILRFIAKHEPLALTLKAFPEFDEVSLRESLLALGDESAEPPAAAPSATNGDKSRGAPRGNTQETTQGVLPGFEGVEARASRRAQLDAQRAEHVEAAAQEKRQERAVRTARRFVLNTDGASRGNPGLAGAGWVISSPSGEVLQTGHAFLGKRTNNEAEYEAVIRGLAAALALGAEEIVLRADSELLIRQITGVYQVRNPRMAQLFAKVQKLLTGLRGFKAEHVRRELNAGADEMANRAIDERE